MLTRIAFALALFTAFACGQPSPSDSAQAQAAQEYTGQGTVRALDAGARRITLEHGDIAGYMPAMTMPFDVAQGVSLEGIAVGTRVEFRFHPESGGRHVVTSLRKL